MRAVDVRSLSVKDLIRTEESIDEIMDDDLTDILMQAGLSTIGILSAWGYAGRPDLVEGNLHAGYLPYRLEVCEAYQMNLWPLIEGASNEVETLHQGGGHPNPQNLRTLGYWVLLAPAQLSMPLGWGILNENQGVEAASLLREAHTRYLAYLRRFGVDIDFINWMWNPLIVAFSPNPKDWTC